MTYSRSDLRQMCLTNNYPVPNRRTIFEPLANIIGDRDTFNRFRRGITAVIDSHHSYQSPWGTAVRRYEEVRFARDATFEAESQLFLSPEAIQANSARNRGLGAAGLAAFFGVVTSIGVGEVGNDTASQLLVAWAGLTTAAATYASHYSFRLAEECRDQFNERYDGILNWVTAKEIGKFIGTERDWKWYIENAVLYVGGKIERGLKSAVPKRRNLDDVVNS